MVRVTELIVKTEKIVIPTDVVELLMVMVCACCRFWLQMIVFLCQAGEKKSVGAGTDFNPQFVSWDGVRDSSFHIKHLITHITEF